MRNLSPMRNRFLAELISHPTLQLLFRPTAAQQQLTNRMRSRIALLQCVLQIIDEFLGPKQTCHNPPQLSVRHVQILWAHDSQVPNA